MTGNSNKLLAVLATYKPAPWRGRYSLSRLFFNFYLLVMGSFVAIAIFADFVISTAVKGITDDYTSRFMRGTVLLIEDELFRRPRSEWPKAIEALDRKFAYKLSIVDRWTLNLPPIQAARLDSGELAIDVQGDIIYHRLKQTPQILVVGPISPERNPEYPRGIPLDLRISLLTWSLIGVCLAIVVWLWVHPVWRDLEAMRQTARALGEGLFEARAPSMRSSAFRPLAETLNGMAERIQRLIATQKELSSAISHELRTPIARLRFALEILADTPEPCERERLWRTMEADLDELDGLIDSSLTYARFEREQPELDLTAVEIAPWLEEQVEASRMLARRLELRVDHSTLPPLLRVELDLKSMPYAITNLLRNAIKYAKTRIIVSAEVLGDQIQVHVDDDGIGIPVDERERVFSAFTRLDRSRDRATGGYGLGLAIARLVLEQHGGNASAAASPLGGARFTLSWPLSQNVTES
ncbi:MAG TPA: ATP-binding protein [Accumulibacter sp.]|uniref:histidine kinase n=2 Tax=Candidatus Accumulibacter TaxID=327159 RepID=A0A080M2K3_9PROT|nr:MULTISPECIES: ATP-binding protein [Candidatus Accumulibacter]KFB75301.1 MAG: Sensor protein RstB [Candidatus Accumulibacter cognatus]MBL8402660.1 two-component sensor histidine kinase [Accumulibacter sp.]MCC2868712.1 two-component sensor histidine kinase [Candidatus Accumulibacter phosphatis]MCM8578922.1 ATP-binding protein [Accumulibacter sp.]MCM8621575.1 ATP-binding protein [Accumulibacter sp.]